MLAVEQIRDALRAQAFRPFAIHLADGRGLRIDHADAIAWDSPRIILVCHVGGREIIEAAMVTGIRVPLPSQDE